ncbi:MAG: hypothetical protein HZB81_04080 [Deltaproteobacteria bacterium]|nr:hypothetical protein [Deltaproteobacteria bacterium]
MKPYIGYAANIHSAADMSYQQSTSTAGGQTTESTSFNEGYSFGLSHELTSTINISADVRLARNITNGQETASTFPMFYLNYSPPSVELYYLSFGYNRNETVPPGGDPISSSNMNASFVLPGDKWPSVSLSYNQSTNNDYLDPHKLDTLSTNKNFNTIYNFNFLETATNLNYSYSDPISIDRVGKTRSEAPSHTVTAGLSRGFWEGKIQTGANIGYSQSKSVNESKSISATNVEGKLARDNGLADGLYSIDTTPLVDSLASTSALIDNNTGSSAGIDLNGLSRNIGVRFTTAQKVHGINLYISTSDALIATYSFGWQLYTSSDGTNWTLIGTPSTSYEASYQRIAFSFSETSASYFKVVNTSFPAAALAINVTEIEAIGYVPTLSSTTRDFGGFNISFAPFSRLNMNYNISYDHSAQDIREYNPTTEKRYLPFGAGNVTSTTDSTNISQSFGLSSAVVPKYLNFSTSYNTSTSNTTSTTTVPSAITSTESGSNGYSLSFSSGPLPTLSASLNYGYSEYLTGGEKNSENSSIGGNVFMNLYKGVDLGLGSSMGESKDLKAKSQTDSANYYGNLNLIPWRSLTIIVNGSISDSTAETAGNATHSSGKTLSSTISYTPTRNLYLSASIGIEPTSSQTYAVTWLPALLKNVQLSTRYGTSGDVTNMGGDISWTPVPRLSLRVGYSGSKTDNITQDHTESVVASASLRL